MLTNPEFHLLVSVRVIQVSSFSGYSIRCYLLNSGGILVGVEGLRTIPTEAM